MPKSWTSKLAQIPIAKVNAPQGGLFAGRNIPRGKLEDPQWLRVLELPPPPEDGLYISRASLTPKPRKKKVGLLQKVANALVSYERGDLKSIDGKSTQIKPKEESATAPATAPATAHASTRLPVVEDWKTLPADIETAYLGLEQLPKHGKISIIGAGITGLTLAWLLSRARPDVQIDIFDSRSDVGGWMQSQVVDLPHGGGQTLFESGPRTLLPSHPGSEIVARMLSEIEKRDEIMAGLPRDSPTNRKGLVFNGEVVQLPSSWAETARFALRSPLLKSARFEALKDLWRPARHHEVNDESVKSFVSRRIGAPLAERMISAVMRGIYAADIDKLSIRSVARLNRLFYLERTEKMGVLAALFSGSASYLDQYNKFALPLVFDALAPPTREKSTAMSRHLVNKQHPNPKFSLYGFKSGIQSLARALADDLRTQQQVQIHLNAPVQQIVKGAQQVQLQLSSSQSSSSQSSSSHSQSSSSNSNSSSSSNGSSSQSSSQSTHSSDIVVSTVAVPSLFPEPIAAELAQVQYSSLAVVNVWVPEHLSLAKDWFGILVPATENAWNTQNVLGVIFDSSVRNAMKPNKEDHERGGSMTVMIGGDLWKEGLTTADAERAALAGLKAMKLVRDETLPEDVVIHAALQRNAIPLYEVGHADRQQRVHELVARHYGNRVALAGMAFGRGCGVSDCVIDALTLALRFSEQRKLLYPQYFFNHWWAMTRPNYYA